MARTSRQDAGNDGERRAAEYLEASGHTVLARNWRCRVGELDIVACDPSGTLVFVEVRSRRNSAAFGGAIASITATKQQRLLRAAELYRQVTHRQHLPCRFDVVLIDAGTLDWIRDAFQAS